MFEYKACIPKNEHTCAQLVVKSLEKDQLKAEWYGKSLDLGPYLKDRNGFRIGVVAIEFGDSCTLACGEGEAQFDFQARFLCTTSVNFLLQGGNGITICSASSEKYFSTQKIQKFFTMKTCLPKDDCYTLTFGNGISGPVQSVFLKVKNTIFGL